MPSQYPTALDTTTTLSTAVNGLSTTLTGDHTSGATTITVGSTAGAAAAGYVWLDAEVIKYAGVTPTTLTGCTRGADNTAAAQHSNGVTVKFGLVADHHNALVSGLIAAQTKLGLNTNGASASSIDAGQLAAGSSATLTTFTATGLLTGAGVRDSRGAAGANLGGVHLGTITLGAGTTTFNIPSPTVWNTIRCILREGTTPTQAGNDNIAMRINGDVGATYNLAEFFSTSSGAFAGAFPATGTVAYLWPISGTTIGALNPGFGWLEINAANSANNKGFTWQGRYGTAATNQVRIGWGTWLNTAAITSIGFLSLTGPGTLVLAGTIEVYGYY